MRAAVEEGLWYHESWAVRPGHCGRAVQWAGRQVRPGHRDATAGHKTRHQYEDPHRLSGLAAQWTQLEMISSCVWLALGWSAKIRLKLIRILDGIQYWSL